MKNLIFKSSFHEKLKMLLIAVGLVVTSLTSPMWGGDNCDFLHKESDDVWIKYVTDAGTTQKNLADDGESDIELGSLTNLSISEFRAITKKHDGNVCHVKMYYGINTTKNGTKGSNVQASYNNSGYSDWTWDNWWAVQQFKNTSVGIDLIRNRKPGNYYFDFCFAINGNSGGTSGCYEDQKWWSNNGGNYHICYTIPNPTITISGFSSLVAGTAASVSASISSYPVGATLTKLEVSGNVASSVNKTGTGTSISSLSFTPNASGSNGITVTVTVKYGTAGTMTYAYQYNVSPPAVSDFTITPSGAGYLSSGNGTDDSPYLVTYNGTITFGLSGATKAATDDNSSAQYSTDGTNYGTTGTYISKTHSSVTQTTNQNWKYKARLKNNSAALYGAVKEKTVYWKVPTSTVTLHDNNGGSHNGSATTNHGKTALSIITEPEKTGYHVDGYYEEAAKTHLIANANGALQTSTSYTDANSKWNSISNQTLYTKWAANTYTIKFSANDANYPGPAATGSTADINATYDVSYTLTTNGYSKEGYTFNGWSQNADGTGTQYTDGQSGVSNLTTVNEGTATLYAKWTGLTYTVTFNPKGGTNLNHHDATVTMGALYTAGTGLGGALPTVTPPAGYVFDGWYTAATGGTKITASSKVATPSDHTLYAHYVEKAQVYFKNTLGWSQVWVTYDANWDNTQGTGNQGKTYHRMNLVPGTTDVYYDDIPDGVLSSWKWNIAFNNLDYSSTPFYAFNNGEAVYRMDFDRKSTMFVPTSNTGSTADGNYQKNGVQYRSTGYSGESSNPKYTSGYWRTYNHTYSGYTMTYQKNGGSWSSGHKMESSSVSDNVFIYTVSMDANSQYNFAFYKERDVNTKSVQFRYGSQITSSGCTNLKLVCDPQNAWMQTTVASDYTFKLEMKNDGHMYLTVEYPVRANDYRVVYTWNDGSNHTYNSEIIRAAAGTNETISVFIHSSSDASNRSLKIAKCTEINASGVPTWNNSYATIDISSVSESGVYNFIITQDGSAAATGAYWNKYTGNYYIRTAASDGGWDMYKYRPDNVMTYSDYSLKQTLSPPYSHYYCRFIESTSTDITYCIATDYSPNITGTMTGDATIGNAATTLPASANVRFTWNQETNALRRAYLKNAQGNENARFLVLHGSDNKVRDASGNTIPAAGNLNANELLFTDLGNWVYQVSLKAQPGAKVSLIANYNSADRYLIGGASSYEEIIGGSGSNAYAIMAVYDYKTNRLMTAWTPDGEVTESLDDVDVLLIRHAQDAGTAITFSLGKTVDAKEVIGAIRLDYNELVGRVASWTSTSRQLLKYFISFPFDVNVSDVFGLNSAYGEAYIIQKYDGATRASKGFFVGDGTSTFWTTLKAGDKMNKNEGYCVILDNDYFNGDIGNIWQNKAAGSSVYLYFPSAETVGEIATTSKTITVPEHKCTIDRTFTSTQAGGRTVNHKNTDSNWNMMGIPVFITHQDDGTGSGKPGDVFATSGNIWDTGMNYFYEWNTSDNKYYIHTAVNYAFKSMHGYMVQYQGDVTFNAGGAPSSVAARKAPLTENYQVELQVLNSDEVVINRAYVELRENACDTFALNEDVYMTPNQNMVDVFTFAGNYDVAANVLPIEDQTVQVGLNIQQPGTYIFSMPSNFSGTATLIDTFTGARTNLALSDYEVQLEKGIDTERFLLELNIEKVTTVIDTVNGNGLPDSGVRKVLIDGVLYIVKDGKVFDARGARIQ